MKKLIISLKSPSDALKEFKNSFKLARKGKLKDEHFEIAFDNQKDFSKFLRNINILMVIQILKPSSVYELSKILNKDQSNVNKIISFFESYGIIRIKKLKRKNRTIKKPIVDYHKIEFNLMAA